MRNKKNIHRLITYAFAAFALALALYAGCTLIGYQKIDFYLKEQNFQGAALIAKEGKILFCKGYGLANIEHLVPNTPQTVFYIGSLTKQFTAVAILQLQERGLLDIHAPIATYLPDYPQGERITIHHLLSHSSGIPSITKFPNLLEIQRQPSSPLQTLGYFKDLPLHFTPGTDCEYSDSGYIVLGALIEAVAHQPYAQYLQENLFEPLGMNSTYYASNHLIIPNRASGYTQAENGELQQAAYIEMSFPHASGGLASTVEDLYRLNQALRKGFLLKKESLEALFTIQAANTDRRIAYGYGFRVGPQNRGMEGCREYIVGHFGSIDGFEAAAIHYADEDLTIILLSNKEKTDVRSFHQELAHLARSSWRARAVL